MPAQPWETLSSALAAYAAGAIAIYAWTLTLHRRHGLTDRRAAVAPALLGGALGGTCALLIAAADQMEVFGL